MSKLRQSTSFSVPAPIGGLNALDSMAAMPETDAVVMRNFYPQSYGVGVRKGYQEFALGMTGKVRTLMCHDNSLGVQAIFAADDTHVYNITAGGVMTAGQRVCVSNGVWQSTTVANSVSVYLMAFNGVDDGFLYSTAGGYHPLVVGDGVTAFTWKNVDPKLLVQPIVHQHRVWAVEKNSTRAWYLPSDQIWGIATSFNFGANFTRGGYLQALMTYTLDSGYGPNDYLVAISSAGEVVMYSGTDPASITTWGLVGVFYAGATFTRRCWTKFGGDVAILTQFGLLTLNAIVRPEPGYVLGNPLSQKIQRLISQTMSAAYSYTGWSLHNYIAENMMLINVPSLASSNNIQIVYNTITRAWTMFNGIAAECWTTTNVGLMFGEQGKVYLAWTGYKDGVLLDGSGGREILAECQQAFSYFGMPGVTKHYKMIRPTFMHNGDFDCRVSANMGFDFETTVIPGIGIRSTPGIWDQSFWDSGAVWTGGVTTDKQWTSVTGLGFAAAARVSVSVNSEVVWIATDWLAEKGGVI